MSALMRLVDGRRGGRLSDLRSGRGARLPQPADAADGRGRRALAAGGQAFWLEGVVDAADKADRLSADDERDTQRIPPGGTPGYAVLTLRGGIARGRRRLQLTLALENVMDEDYRIHGSGVNEPGRNLVLQADWTF